MTSLHTEGVQISRAGSSGRHPGSALGPLLALGLGLLLIGCAGEPVRTEAHAQESFPGDGPPVISSSFSPQEVTAFDDGRHLYLGYSLDGIRATLVGELDLPGAANAPDRTVIGRLEPLQVERWNAAVRTANPLEVLDRNRWSSLLAHTMASLLPAGHDQGVVVDVLLVEELFTYRDVNDQVQSVPMAMKPRDVGVAASYTFGELLMRAGDHLEMLGWGTRGGRLLFVTGDLSSFGYPFVLVDTADGTFRFLHDASLVTHAAGTPQVVTLARTLGHTVTSHLQAPIDSPVSSLARLFTLLVQSAPDLVKPTTLALLGSGDPPQPDGGPGMDLESWEAELDELVGATQTRGRLTYLVDGEAFFPRLFEMLNQAERQVDLRLYIFDNDDYALRVADLLKSRSREIEIRVLIDGLGTIAGANATSPSVPPSHAAPWSVVNYLRDDSRVDVRVLRNAWLMGDHSKSIVVDGRTAFIGGMNIGREYRYDWHDLMIEVEGPVVGLIEEDFEKSWRGEGLLGDLQRLIYPGRDALPEAAPDHYPVRVLFTRPGDPQILRAQVAAMRSARKRIYIQNAYLTSDTVVYELVKARRRGVDVRVIVPAASDSGLISRSNVVAANALLRHGIRVYVYPGMSHVKAAVYDGWACFGSANFDYLSLRVNKELNLATSHPPAVDALVEQLFEVDFARALELTEPLPGNWGDYLAEMLADFL
jgi:cardiolipin synthase